MIRGSEDRVEAFGDEIGNLDSVLMRPQCLNDRQCRRAGER